MPVPWPESVWIERLGLQVTQPGQIVRRSPGRGPHNPNPPRWRITTAIRNQDTREMNLFLNSLGGASQVVELPLSGPNVLFPLDDNFADEGEWSVASAVLGRQYLEAAIVPRAGVDPPPAGAPLLVGSASATRLYEVRALSGDTLLLNPRVEAPTGTTRLFRASSVPVRLDTSRNPSWGVRDNSVPGSYPGTALSWIEAT